MCYTMHGHVTRGYNQQVTIRSQVACQGSGVVNVQNTDMAMYCLFSSTGLLFLVAAVLAFTHKVSGNGPLQSLRTCMVHT
jgi:hypothetical protein